jgi:hypothetical protein
MAEEVDFAGLIADLRQSTAVMTEIHGEVIHPPDKELFGAALGELKRRTDELAQVYPGELAKIEQEAKAIVARAEQLQTEAASLREKIAATQAEAATRRAAAVAELLAKPPLPITIPTPKAVPQLNPALGTELRAELLRRYGWIETDA